MAWKSSSITMPLHEWMKVRKNVLMRDSFKCVMCGRKAEQVDHIQPKAEGGSDLLSNLQSLCINHHKQKTLKEAAAGRRRYHRSRLRNDTAYQGPKRKL